MTTPITADYFASHGVDATTAAELARQHNALAGSGSAATPPPDTGAPPTVRSAPPPSLNPAHQGAIDKRVAELKALNIDEATARQVAAEEARYARGSGVDRAAMLSELEHGRTEDAIRDSISAGMEPPRAPHEYVLPPSEGEDGAAIDRSVREAMFAAGVPREIGNGIARDMERTATALLSASPAQVEQYMADQDAALHRVWGADYDRRLAMTRDFLRSEGERSPVLKSLVGENPELFASWEVVTAIARVAEHQQRIAKR